MSLQARSVQMNADGFEGTRTSAILTMPAGPGSLGLKTGAIVYRRSLFIIMMLGAHFPTVCKLKTQAVFVPFDFRWHL